MSFLFGRRRSSSDGSADQVKESSGRPPNPHQRLDRATDASILHGLFRRRSDTHLTRDSSKTDQQSIKSSRAVPHLDIDELPKPERNSEQGRSSSRASSPGTPGGLESPSGVTHREPKQPGNIQDYLEFRLEESSKTSHDGTARNESSQQGQALTKKDVKAILSGAPHFLLEKGKHGRWYPQVIFPWDEHNPSIQRMLDRKPLIHPSFTLCTLHAHLPVPDDWVVKGGVPRPLHDWRRTGAYKRATFDIGVFEVPNMLANNGKEPGTVGMRHFLEGAIADVSRYTGSEEPKDSPDMQRLQSLPATVAFDLLNQYNKPYSQCQSGAVLDRHRLIREGPAGWKRIGVRDINLQTLAQRLDQLRKLRLEILLDGSPITITDIETPRELHNILHTNFLYPHPPPADVMPGHPESLKSQIKTLTMVLATPGAWVDFSLPEWRFRAGQILWETSPHADGDCVNSSMLGNGKTYGSWMNSGTERKWLLIQLLLAAELLFRLDAFVSVGMLHDSRCGLLTVPELDHFDKLRDGKVNWDLVVVRRFLDNLQITWDPIPNGNSPVSPASPNEKPPGKSHRFPLFDSMGRRASSTADSGLRSAWQFQIDSPHVRQQLEGLYVFADNIGWPRIDRVKAVLEQKLRKGKDFVLPALDHEGLQAQMTNSTEPLATRPMKRKVYAHSQSNRRVIIRSACPEHGNPPGSEILGWISRSWLSGFVIPGDAISHLLIGTLLENDADVVKQLGPTANLYGGFIYSGRSWWSKACIVGRVLSSLEGSKTCMGWISTDVLPRDTRTLNTWRDGWLEVQVHAPPVSSRRPRIKHGGKLALESSPLGMGSITADDFTLPIDPPASTTTSTVVLVGALTVSAAAANKEDIATSDETSLSFSLEDARTTESPTTVNFLLKYNVRFISAHECRAPRGFTSHHSDCFALEDSNQTTNSDSNRLKRLSSHPLHRYFSFQYTPLTSLPQRLAPQTEARTTPEIVVIDARGSRAKETFARAWCASVGCHAIIGRTGKTCIGCCVREARALDVAVVVRVGE